MTYGPADVFLGAARALLFVREEPKNSNAGQAVRAFLALCGLKEGEPWCMAYLHYVGRACFGALWPLPLSASCAATLAAARKKGMMIAAGDVKAGDFVFVWHQSLNRHAHVYVVSGPRVGVKVPTLEGNTNDGGSRDGWGVFERMRTIAPRDEVVRWTGAMSI